MEENNYRIIPLLCFLLFVLFNFQPSTVRADSRNVVTAVPSIAKDFQGTASTVVIIEENVPFGNRDIFQLVLPSGVEWNYDFTGSFAGTVDGSRSEQVATYYRVGDHILEVHVTGISNYNLEPKDRIEIPMNIKVTGAIGPLKVTIEPMDSTITAGQYTFANVATKPTSAYVDQVKDLSFDGKTGTIRIDEMYIQALGTANQSRITLKLPRGFKWDYRMEADTFGSPYIIFAGGLTGSTLRDITVEGRTLSIEFDPVMNRTSRGTIFIYPYIRTDNLNLDMDVPVYISGDDVTEEEVLLVKYISLFNNDGIVDLHDIVNVAKRKPQLYNEMMGRFGEQSKKLYTVDSVFQVGSNQYIVNGAANDLSVSPYIKNGQVYLPVLAEPFGFEGITVNEYYKTASFKDTYHNQYLFKDQDSNFTVGAYSERMSLPAEIINGKLMLPVNFLHEQFGFPIHWDQITNQISVRLIQGWN